MSPDGMEPEQYRRLFDSIVFAVETGYLARQRLNGARGTDPRLQILSARYGSPFEIIIGLVGASAGLGASVAAIISVLSGRSIKKEQSLAEIRRIDAEVRKIDAEVQKLNLEIGELHFDAYDRRRHDSRYWRLSNDLASVGAVALEGQREHILNEVRRLEGSGSISAKDATALRAIANSLTVRQLDYLVALDEYGVEFHTRGSL